MMQLLQRLDSGATMLIDVPAPAPSGPRLLVETRATVISPGTERMLVEFGRASMVEKARQQPDRVRQVLDKMRTDGVGPTLDAVRAKLEAPIPLGYCQAGVIISKGDRAGRFKTGDRVATNGPHAEYVSVSHTLAAKIPDGVSFESAAFTPLAAIGLQGVRLAEPSIGETVVVYGLGVIGLLTVQLLRANGCRVLGIDRDAARLELAEQAGATAVDGSDGDAAAKVLAATGGIGADAVLLTLASSSDDPIHQAAEMSRKRGRVVLVGVTGLDLARDDFYRKELSFTVSCSYGPGRYDPEYEVEARDYPLPFVRWTEQRNFEAVLGLMADGKVDPTPLITHRYPFAEAVKAYGLITSAEPSLGIVLRFPERGSAEPSISSVVNSKHAAPRAPHQRGPGTGSVGVIGAGNFAVRTLLPALKGTGARLVTIASGGGTSGAIAGAKFGFERSTTDIDVILDDDSIDTVFILTRHNAHASLAAKALEAGKHVFVEKPLALTEHELELVTQTAARTGKFLMVGFNRRFAPLAAEAREYLRKRTGPASVLLTVNAGMIPRDHWTQDPHVGGGRLVGEACHWIDLARYLIGEEIIDVSVTPARDRGGVPIDDIAHVAIAFSGGSTAVVHYLASGASSFPKERVECFFDGKTLVIDNWRRLRRFGIPGRWLERKRRSDKGHVAEISSWMAAVQEGRESPIPLSILTEVSRWSIIVANRAREFNTATPEG